MRAPWDDGAANVEPVGQRHYSNQGEDVERDYTPSSSGAPRPTQSQDEGTDIVYKNWTHFLLPHSPV